MRLVLYAEGVGETGGRPVTPGLALDEDALGAGHVLVRRTLSAACSIPERSVTFIGPLRKKGGLHAVGSDLLVPKTLVRLLTFQRDPPDLAMVLVDEDGNGRRYAELREATKSATTRRVIAVARQEFESWLLADLNAVRRALSTTVDEMPVVEDMQPGEAKARLAELSASAALHATIAALADVEILRSGSRSFARFFDDVRATA